MRTLHLSVLCLPLAFLVVGDSDMSGEDNVGYRPVKHNIQGNSDSDDSECSVHSTLINTNSEDQHLINHHHLAPKDR